MALIEYFPIFGFDGIPWHSNSFHKIIMQMYWAFDKKKIVWLKSKFDFFFIRTYLKIMLNLFPIVFKSISIKLHWQRKLSKCSIEVFQQQPSAIENWHWSNEIAFYSCVLPYEIHCLLSSLHSTRLTPYTLHAGKQNEIDTQHNGDKKKKTDGK